MTKKTSAVAKKKETAIVAANSNTMAWSDEEEVEAKDILIPKLFVLNSNSAICVEDPDNYRAGDIIRSTDKKKLGNTKEGLDFVPVADTKVWKVSKKGDSRFEFVRFEAYNRNTADLPWSWEENGEEWRRDATVNMFCLLPADILKEQKAISDFEAGGDIPDPDDVMLPCCISFSRTSYSAAKILLTHKAKCKQMSLNMAVKTFTLGTKLESKNDNKYYVLTVEGKERTNPDFMEACGKWHNTLKASPVQVDEAAEEEATGSEKVSDKF